MRLFLLPHILYSCVIYQVARPGAETPHLEHYLSIIQLRQIDFIQALIHQKHCRNNVEIRKHIYMKYLCCSRKGLSLEWGEISPYCSDPTRFWDTTLRTLCGNVQLRQIKFIQSLINHKHCCNNAVIHIYIYIHIHIFRNYDRFSGVRNSEVRNTHISFLFCFDSCLFFGFHRSPTMIKPFTLHDRHQHYVYTYYV